MAIIATVRGASILLLPCVVINDLSIFKPVSFKQTSHFKTTPCLTENNILVVVAIIQSEIDFSEEFLSPVYCNLSGPVDVDVRKFIGDTGTGCDVDSHGQEKQYGHDY